MGHAGGERRCFPYSNAVRGRDSSRARQAEESSGNMPLRWWQHGRECHINRSPSSPFPASQRRHGGGGPMRFASSHSHTILRAEDVHADTLMDGWMD
jgi:hypothetical protein